MKGKNFSVLPISDHIAATPHYVTAPTIEEAVELVHDFIRRMRQTPVHRFYAATPRMHYYRYYEIGDDGRARRKADRKR